MFRVQGCVNLVLSGIALPWQWSTSVASCSTQSFYPNLVGDANDLLEDVRSGTLGYVIELLGLPQAQKSLFLHTSGQQELFWTGCDMTVSLVIEVY